jgi:arabinofuranan 3-O-arabinosyltransferase
MSPKTAPFATEIPARRPRFKISSSQPALFMVQARGYSTEQRRARKGLRMVAPASIPEGSQLSAVPAPLLNVCFVLLVINVAFFPAAFFAHWWIFDAGGHGIPTDFVNVWSAGKLVLEGQPALAYDWNIQKQLEVATLGQSYDGNFAWHYPPPFLFVASLLALFPYAVAYIGWAAASFVPYLVMMRSVVGRRFGLVLAAAFPVVLTNALVGQNGFLTASLIGGTLVLLPSRPVLSGICLGLLSYKPQYGLLFPLLLVATSQWRVFVTAAVVAAAMALASWLAFGTQSWQAFVHWLPMFSQAFLTEGRAYWGKMQSIFALVRFFGGGELLAWVLQWILTGTVAVVLVVMWRSRIDYALKAAGLAIGTLLVTPYLFLYDLMVLAVPVGFLVRLGLSHGFRRFELPALGLVAFLLMFYPLFAAPTGFAATLIVAALVGRRCGFWRSEAETSELIAARA